MLELEVTVVVIDVAIVGPFHVVSLISNLT
jgi:hypothetical protein